MTKAPDLSMAGHGPTGLCWPRLDCGGGRLYSICAATTAICHKIVLLVCPCTAQHPLHRRSRAAIPGTYWRRTPDRYLPPVPLLCSTVAVVPGAVCSGRVHSTQYSILPTGSAAPAIAIKPDVSRASIKGTDGSFHLVVFQLAQNTGIRRPQHSRLAPSISARLPKYIQRNSWTRQDP